MLQDHQMSVRTYPCVTNVKALVIYCSILKSIALTGFDTCWFVLGDPCLATRNCRHGD